MRNYRQFVAAPADRFIHLSSPGQVRDTLVKFKGQTDLILVCVDLSKVDGEVVWEVARNDQLYPHVYGAIPPSSVVWIADLPWTTTGFILPANLQNPELHSL